MMRYNSAPTAASDDLVAHTLEVLPLVARVLRQAALTSGDESLTLSQVRLLKAISQDCNRTGDLATRFDLAPATISATVDSLVRRGFVVRSGRASREAGDRRVVPLFLTEAGTAALAAAYERQRTAIRVLLQGASTEEQAMLGAANAIWERQLRMATVDGSDGP